MRRQDGELPYRVTLKCVPDLDTPVVRDLFQFYDLREGTFEARDEPIAVLVAPEHWHEVVYMSPRSVHPQAFDPNPAEDGFKPRGVVSVGMREHEVVDVVRLAIVFPDVVYKLLPVVRITAVHNVYPVAAVVASADCDGVSTAAVPCLDEVDFDEVRHLKRSCCSSCCPNAYPGTIPCTT